MTTATVRLPVSVLAAVAEREGAGPLHLSLQPEPMWLPDADLAAWQSSVDEQLARAGLVDRRGRLDADVLDWLPVLTSASIEYYGWLSHGDETWSVLVAARGVLGVVAVRHDDVVSVSEVNSNDLVGAFVGQLPELVAGGGAPWSVRVIDLEEASRDRARRVPAGVGEVVKVVQRPVTGGGELYVAERDELGRYRRLEEPLHYVDTDWGRYLNYTTGRGDSAEVHIAPGGAAAIASALEGLRARLTG